MRAFEFLKEDAGDIKPLADIVTALTALHNRVIEGELPKKLPTAMILRYIKNAGVTSIDYQDLLTANDDTEVGPAIKELISNITPDSIEFKTDIETSITNPDDVKTAAENPEEKVSKMADRALKRRQK